MPNLPHIPVDILILATILFTAYSGFKRGLFREILIAIAYVPYMAAMFYLFNEFIQGQYSFDSILYKVSALGGFYVAYLFVIWGTAKSLQWQFNRLDNTLLYTSKTLAGIISGARTVYFCFLCLIAFNLHIHNDNMLERSQLATAANPLALKTQDLLLKKGYINNEITIYSDAINGTFDREGNYEHPIVKKIKNSERFKEIESKLDKDKMQKQIEQYINRY